MIGFSEVTLTEQTLADYADTLAYLGAAIRLYRDTFRRLGLLGGQDKGQDGQDGDGQQPTGKTGERFKVACGCQPPRSFWIRAKQYTPGPSPAGSAARTSNPRTPPAIRHVATLVCSCTLRSPRPAGIAGQAAGWKRIRAWSASSATLSGPSTAGRARSMLGRRRAATTGTPCVTTLPQGTWAP